MNTHRSFAQWPKGTIGTDNDISTDDHYSEGEALGVCTLLGRNGFGGDGKVFPLRTWVEPIAQPLPAPASEERATPTCNQAKGRMMELATGIVGEAVFVSVAEALERQRDSLIERVAALEAGWQPIETAEKSSKAILLWCPERRNIYMVTWNRFEQCWSIWGSHGLKLSEEPTQWRLATSTPPTIDSATKGER